MYKRQLLRRRDLWERHALRTSEKLLRAAVSREDLPPALDVRLSNVYLHSLVEGVSVSYTHLRRPADRCTRFVAP